MNAPRFLSPPTEKSEYLLALGALVKKGQNDGQADVFPRVEVAVKQILSSIDIRTSASVANPECLDWYRQWNSDHK